MSKTRQFQIWAGVALLFFTLLWLLGDMLTPFVVGLVIAYLLDPLVECLRQIRIGRFELPRAACSALVLLFFIMIIVMAVMLAAPLVQHQLAGLIEAVPAYTTEARQNLAPRLSKILSRLSPADAARLREAAGNFAATALTEAGAIMQKLIQSGAALASVVSVIAITPVVAFYMMKDWQIIKTRFDDLLPRRHAPTIRMLMKQIDTAIAGFIRGQSMVCLALGAIYAIGLSLIGLDFGFVVGASAGLLSFVPYVGTITGLLTSLCLGFFQFDDPSRMMMVLLVFGFGQVMEGYVLTPRLVGGSIGLNPVWVMFALLAGASLFGFVGLLVAVPVAAIMGVLIRFAIQQYKNSLLYDDTSRKTVLI